MPKLIFTEKLDQAQHRLQFMLDRSDQLVLQPELLSSLLEELAITIEEIQVQQSEIIETRRELELQRQYYQELFELAPDCYIITDLFGIIKDCNQATYNLLHTKSNFLKNKPLPIFIKETERRKFRTQLNHLRDNKQVQNWETYLRSKNGQLIPVMISVSTIYNWEKKPSGLRWLIRNISQTKEIQNNLEKEKEIAEQAQERTDLLMAELSHELRNPLTPIIGFCNLLKKEKLSAKQVEYVKHIENSSNQMLILINRFLELSKLKSDHFTLEEKPFNLQKLIEEDCLGQFYPVAKAKNLQLSYTLDPQIPQILIGDQTHLTQILANLLNNGIKFTPTGGITIEIKKVQADHLYYENPLNPIIVKFSVQDTGIGIPEESLQAIFDPFTQSSLSASISAEGVGLGLAIVKTLCQKMGGKIGVESNLDQGSIFDVTLPFTI